MTHPCDNCGRPHNRISFYCCDGCRERYHAFKRSEKKSGKKDDSNWGCGCLVLLLTAGLLFSPSKEKNASTDSKAVSATLTAGSVNLNGAQNWVVLKDVNGQTLEVIIHGVKGDYVVIERRDGSIFNVAISALNEASKLEVAKRSVDQDKQQNLPVILSTDEKDRRRESDRGSEKKLTESDLNSSYKEDKDDGWINIEHIDGRTIRAKILSLHGSQALIRRGDGQEFELSLSSVSENSRALIHANFRKHLIVGEVSDFKTERNLKYAGKTYVVSKILRVSESIVELTTPEGVIGVPVKAIPAEWLRK